MSDIQPHARPISHTGAAEWAPTVEDDAALAPPPRKQGPRDIFFGADGLRAGWSVLLFALFVKLCSVLINLTIRAARHDAPPPHAVRLETVAFVLRMDWGGFAVFALSALLVSLIERRSFGRYGIGTFSSRRIRQFLLGAALGLGLLALLVFVLLRTGHIALDGVLLHGAASLRYGLPWFLAFLGVGFMEEFFTRGFLQFTLTRGFAGFARATGLRYRTSVVLAFWATAFLFSVLFGLGHTSNPGESPIGLLSAGLIGLVFAFSLWRTGSLWWAIGFHAAWDWAQSFLFGTADSGLLVENHFLASHPVGAPLVSGGLTGPEGSVFVLGAILITWLTIFFALPPEPGSYANPDWTPNHVG